MKRTTQLIGWGTVCVAWAMLYGRELSAQTGTEARSLPLVGEYRGVHDPSMIKQGDTYYVFATGAAYAPLVPGQAPPPPPAPGDPPRQRTPVGQLPIRCSKDLLTWTRCGQVFSAVPEWIKTASPKTQDLWAPDISFFGGLYHLYYAYSVFGKNTSGIALATNVTLDPADPRSKWVDQGLVLESKATDDFNAIDPNLIVDEHGDPWMALGSFWTGIKMRRLDRSTGKLSAVDTKTYALAARAHGGSEVAAGPDLPPDSQAVEAPFILRHGSFYYLFVSWDLCCRGTKSTYREMVGRAPSVTGPYVDRDGKPMAQGGGTPLLQANALWLGPGGASLVHLADGSFTGEDAIVFHAYDATNGRPAMQISTLGWKDGWPSAKVAELSR